MKIIFDKKTLSLGSLGLTLITFVIISFLALISVIYTFVSNYKNNNLKSDEYIVTDVTDGDTIEVTKNNTVLKVRYIGVDTPETVKPATSVQCFGKEASNFNKEIVLNKKVRLESDIGDEDKFGRKLRYVFLVEGENSSRMINELLVQEGYARLETVPPNIKYVEKFKNAERYARENNKGLWKECKINLVDTTFNLYKYIQNVPT